VLGGDEASVQADQQRLQGVRRQSLSMRAQTAAVMHEIRQSDGSVIREYMTPDGRVFAVTWSTHFRPDLETLFGAHAASYTAAAAEAMKSPGIKRQVHLQRDDLVVRASAHLNVFMGRAHVRSLVPAGVDVDALP
jgi:hypothetical protein